METILNMVIDPDNVRMVLLAVLGWSGFVLISSKMSRMEFSLKKEIDGLDRKIDRVEASLNKRIDGIEAFLNKRIDGIEASLSKRMDALERRMDTLEDIIEVLIFVLEKNGSITKEDKEFAGRRAGLPLQLGAQ